MSGDCSERFVDIGFREGIEATDDVRGQVILLGFYRKGVAVMLTYAEALALGRVLRRVAHTHWENNKEAEMSTENDNHAHEHEFVEIVDAETITAFEHSPHGIVTLQFHQRGLSLDLTHEEAVTLGMVMERVVEHVKAKQ